MEAVRSEIACGTELGLWMSGEGMVEICLSNEFEDLVVNFDSFWSIGVGLKNVSASVGGRTADVVDIVRDGGNVEASTAGGGFTFATGALSSIENPIAWKTCRNWLRLFKVANLN